MLQYPPRSPDKATLLAQTLVRPIPPCTQRAKYPWDHHLPAVVFGHVVAGQAPQEAPPGALIISASECPCRSCQADCASKAGAFSLSHSASCALATADTLMSGAFAQSRTSASKVRTVLRRDVDAMFERSNLNRNLSEEAPHEFDLIAPFRLVLS